MQNQFVSWNGNYKGVMWVGATLDSSKKAPAVLPLSFSSSPELAHQKEKKKNYVGRGNSSYIN
eukprot:1137669-Pelagomonas_calceolata.AAC.1